MYKRKFVFKFVATLIASGVRITRRFLYVVFTDTDAQCFSIQHAARAALSAIHCGVVSTSARAAAVYSDSTVVVNTSLCQWQSTEEHFVECRSQSLLECNTAVTT